MVLPHPSNATAAPLVPARPGCERGLVCRHLGVPPARSRGIFRSAESDARRPCTLRRPPHRLLTRSRGVARSGAAPPQPAPPPCRHTRRAERGRQRRADGSCLEHQPLRSSPQIEVAPAQGGGECTRGGGARPLRHPPAAPRGFRARPAPHNRGDTG
jgi:hypothetical protein